MIDGLFPKESDSEIVEIISIKIFINSKLLEW